MKRSCALNPSCIRDRIASSSRRTTASSSEPPRISTAVPTVSGDMDFIDSSRRRSGAVASPEMSQPPTLAPTRPARIEASSTSRSRASMRVA